jgi:hypothetical protein
MPVSAVLRHSRHSTVLVLHAGGSFCCQLTKISHVLALVHQSANGDALAVEWRACQRFCARHVRLADFTLLMLMLLLLLLSSHIQAGLKDSELDLLASTSKARGVFGGSIALLPPFKSTLYVYCMLVRSQLHSTVPST